MPRGAMALTHKSSLIDIALSPTSTYYMSSDQRIPHVRVITHLPPPKDRQQLTQCLRHILSYYLQCPYEVDICSSVDMPPGNFTKKVDFLAIKMTAAHNTFIQGINAIVHHAPTVNEDNSWCSALQCSAISTIITLSKKRKGTLSESIEQHKDFLPGVEALEEWCKKVQKSKEVYDANVLLGLVDAFGDAMIAHLASEISTLDRDVIQAKFTIAELDAIEAEFKKRALGLLDIYIGYWRQLTSIRRCQYV
ncbi:hypothetical protein BYT27DRAFT_7343426 [Phlegmacium glaucopus]|nr:hypothetical protein BYT27DRAFT_7343426 [Phlegmacium glaucopus]